jgi:fatty acid desaturase
MSTEPIYISDPVFEKRGEYNIFQKIFLHFIRDERDLPFIYLCLKISFLVVPAALYLYFSGDFAWYLGAAYLIINLGYFLGPYVLMLHNTSHRKLFKEEYKMWNNYIPWILGPFYGETPETYFYHHVGMHHAENNMAADISSTMNYRRDSLRVFFRNFGRFFIFGIVELSMYFKKKNKTRFLKKILMGEFSFVLLCVLLSFVNWKATLVVFIIPFFFVRFAMMAGNWAQHAFIDPADPANSYRNSITCINTSYNRKCFNDGYHIGHHLMPSMHWTDMPSNFQANKHKYVQNNAIVFKKMDYFFIWFLLMTKNYHYLARNFVDLGNVFKSKEEIVVLLKSRTVKFN